MPAAIRRPRAPSAPSPLHVQRAIIRRQLRLTFIYPIVYLILWMAPFVLHCMQYNMYYAKQPPFALGIIANSCYTLMAAVDCAIFCYRERPWRHIPANKTRGFWSSFFCWSADGEIGCNMTENDDTTGRWGSNGERDRSRRTNRRREGRNESFDSVLSSELGSAQARSNARSGVGTPAARPVRFVEGSPQATQSAGEPSGGPRWQRLASTAAGLPGAVTVHGSKSFRSFLHKAQRSDGQRAAEEGARARLAHEQQDRRDLEEQRLGGGGAEQPAERHWWDSMRKDSVPGEWQGRRKSFFSIMKGDGGSDASSPAQSPGERTSPMAFPDVSPAAASSPTQQARDALHGIEEEADGATSLYSQESSK